MLSFGSEADAVGLSGTVRMGAVLAVALVLVLGAPAHAIDSDGDGVPDQLDNCPAQSNPEQLDVDEDGIGNRCDVCVRVADPDQEDADEDGAGDACDLCAGTEPDVPLPGDEVRVGIDVEGCSVTDRCPCLTRTPLGPRWRSHQEYLVCVRRRARVLEQLGVVDRLTRQMLVHEAKRSICGRRLRQTTDRDGDGVREDGDESRVAGDLPCPDHVRVHCDDNCPGVFNPLQADRDRDGRGDACDPSNDGDPVPDDDDNCPNAANADQADADDDGVGDACDSCEETVEGVKVDARGCSEEQNDAATASAP